MSAPRFLERVGPMEALYRQKDWSQTRVGPPAQWPKRLRGYVDMLLRIPTGTILFWGPDQIQLYNLGYSEIMGPRHPKYLGEPYRDCWPDTFETIYPMMRRVLDEGEVVEVNDALIPVTRYGFVEETYFTFSFVPLRGDDDTIEGFIQHINETTKTMLLERREATLRTLAPRIDQRGGAIAQARAAFEGNPQDIPFAAVFVPAETEGELTLAMAVGADEAAARSLGDVATGVMARSAATPLEDVRSLLGSVHLGPWPETARSGLALPLQRAGAADVRGVVVFAVSARLAFDETYRVFLESAARELASNLAFEQENAQKARMTEELQRRAEALTELDRAKTAFFSNVSHELRTPLTLILGPLEDALGDREHELRGPHRERLELALRSGVRLHKLVNTVLDFTRIEAGRAAASFEATDLAALTGDLASSFRSVIERGGLALQVDCPPLPEAVWVDREMWEKIVLNLVSNAFKFTLNGGVSVSLRANGKHEVVLWVEDTGAGIPEGELSKVFDRFHRVEGTRGRSFEGSGIGLALVQELVRLHGGTVGVTSTLGRGSRFTVTLPTGKAHLPAERVRETARLAERKPTSVAFVGEGASWVTATHATDADALARGSESAPSAGRILLADDNPDMRDYVRRLLEPRFSVEAVSDGLQALQAIERQRPDVVLSDVMMPGLDGFGLLAAIKGSPATKTLPVILLSARAGEESRVQGMEAGADDYLVKPFAARELLARVAARLEIAQLHARASAELERQVEERTAKLLEANQELESFSYSVSHDLRAPLRHIVGFSQLMEKSTAGTLDPQSAGYLKTIAEAAKRGGQLVDDLLAFSRMGRADMRSEAIDLVSLVADVRRELAPDEEGRQIVWRVGELPVVQGDPALLRLVLKNLLGNALKYSRGNATATIEVGAELHPEETEIWVRDDGVGFDMKYVGKLFGVFQRLHTTAEFEGTGIGLALVRRVVKRHGGRTWAEGEMGRGATLHFTLPRASARSARDALFPVTVRARAVQIQPTTAAEPVHRPHEQDERRGGEREGLGPRAHDPAAEATAEERPQQREQQRGLVGLRPFDGPVTEPQANVQGA